MMAHALGTPGFRSPTVWSGGNAKTKTNANANANANASANGLSAPFGDRRRQQTHTDDQLERTVS